MSTIAWRSWWCGEEDLLWRASRGAGWRRPATGVRLWNSKYQAHDEFCDANAGSPGFRRVSGPDPGGDRGGAEDLLAGGGVRGGRGVPGAAGDGDAAQRAGGREAAAAGAVRDGGGGVRGRSGG